MINSILRRTYLLSQALHIDVFQSTSAQRLPINLLGGASKVLSQNNILRIIAKFTAKQIHAAYIGGCILDPNAHRDWGTSL